MFIEGTLQEQRFHDCSRGPLLFMRGFAAMGMESTSGLKDSLLPGSRQTARGLCLCIESKSRRIHAHNTGRKASRTVEKHRKDHSTEFTFDPLMYTNAV